eukprot:superscaffoldBa00000184_g2488
MADRGTFNVVILGVGFLFIFTAFTTCGNIEQTVVKSLENDTFTGSGYHSGYIAVFIIPSTWAFYLTSVLIGIGAAMLWTAQGQFLVENSDASTINRNTGMFWALLQCRLVYACLKETILQLLKAKTMVLLSPCMVYSGLELAFYSGVYGTCIGATTQFGAAAKGLIGISGIVIGIGEIVGGGLFGLLCKNNRFRRTSVVFLGMVVHFVAFYLIFLNIPDDAPVVFTTTTQKNPFLTPSFLLGLGDSCFNTQLYSILGCVYAEHSTPAFAIFKFIQSVFAAVAFFYSGYLLLMWQLLLMVILGFSGTLCFFVVERMQNFSADLQDY